MSTTSSDSDSDSDFASTPRPPGRRLRFDPTINLGHILTFVGFLSAGGVAYIDMQKRLTTHEIRMDAMKDTYETQMRSIEKAMDYDRVVLREQIRAMSDDIKDIRRAVSPAPNGERK